MAKPWLVRMYSSLRGLFVRQAEEPKQSTFVTGFANVQWLGGCETSPAPGGCFELTRKPAAGVGAREPLFPGPQPSAPALLGWPHPVGSPRIHRSCG